VYGKRLCTPITVIIEQLVLKWSDILPSKQVYAEKQKRNFDPYLIIYHLHLIILILDRNTDLRTSDIPLNIQTPTGQIIRNKSDLKPMPYSITSADEPPACVTDRDNNKTPKSTQINVS